MISYRYIKYLFIFLQINHAVDAINNLLHEYLLKNGMLKTLDLFQDEMFEPSKIQVDNSY